MWRSLEITKPWTIFAIAIGAVCVAGAVVAARTISTFGGWSPASAQTLWYIGLWNLAFVAGLALPLYRARLRDAPSWVYVSARRANICVAIFCIIAVVGALILTYEFAYVRGYGLSTSINEIRSLEVARVTTATAGPTGSWRGAAGRLFLSALLAAWVVACVRWRQMKPLTVVLLLASTTLVFWYQLKFEGGRFFFFALVIAGVAASIANFLEDGVAGKSPAPKDFRLSHAMPFVLVAGLTVLVTAYSAQVFVGRGDSSVNRISEIIEVRSKDSEAIRRELSKYEEIGASPYAIAYLQYAMNYPISVSSLGSLEKFTSTNYAIAMSWLYVTQGVSQLDIILNNKDLLLADGFYQFPQIAMLVGMIAKADVRYDEAKNLPVYGAYITLPGAAYVDFGWVGGLLFAAALGAILRRSVDALFARSGSILVFFGPLVFAILLISPVTSLVPVVWPAFLWLGAIALAGLVFRQQ